MKKNTVAAYYLHSKVCNTKIDKNGESSNLQVLKTFPTPAGFESMISCSLGGYDATEPSRQRINFLHLILVDTKTDFLLCHFVLATQLGEHLI
jgi:hypothetical protein